MMTSRGGRRRRLKDLEHLGILPPWLLVARSLTSWRSRLVRKTRKPGRVVMHDQPEVLRFFIPRGIGLGMQLPRQTIDRLWRPAWETAILLAVPAAIILVCFERAAVRPGAAFDSLHVGVAAIASIWLACLLVLRLLFALRDGAHGRAEQAAWVAIQLARLLACAVVLEISVPGLLLLVGVAVMRWLWHFRSVSR